MRDLQSADENRAMASQRWQHAVQQRYARSHSEMTTALTHSRHRHSLQQQELASLRIEHSASVLNDEQGRVQLESLSQEVGHTTGRLRDWEAEAHTYRASLQESESRQGRILAESRDRRQLSRDKQELQATLRRTEASLADERLRNTYAEQQGNLRVAEVEHQVSSVRAEYAQEASQLTRSRESQQTHRLTTEAQITSLRRELTHAQVEIAARPLQDDRAEVELQRQELVEEVRFIASLETEVETYEMCAQIEAERCIRERHKIGEESIQGNIDRMELRTEAEISKNRN